MTEVYRARVADSSGPERPLVLKLLPPSAAGDPQAEARFVEEAKIALSLAHGNIVSTFEAGRDESGQMFLVMEYVAGSSLRALLESAPLREPAALFVAHEVARALRYTHTYVDPLGAPSPIAHLDVTPENILVSFAGQVKLTDFGIARAVGSLSGRSGPYGKAPYAAPELLSGDPGGPRADNYGLGCVLYEMLTGVTPYRGTDDRDTLRLACEGPAACPPSERAEVSEGTDALVMRMLARAPDERDEDARCVERDLGALMKQSAAAFTEVEMAALVRDRIGAAAADDPARRRLLDQIAAAGGSVAGDESLGELLSLGTVPLAALDASAPGVAPRPKRRSLPALVGLGVAAVAVALWAARLPDPPPEVAASPDPPPSVKAEDAETAPVPAPVEALMVVSRSPPDGADSERPPRTKTVAIRRPRSRPPKVRPAPAGPAVLQINSYPYAKVYDDSGKLLGTTPLRDVQLAAGRRTLRFHNPEMNLTREITLDLRPGQRKTVGLRLDRDDDP